MNINTALRIAQVMLFTIPWTAPLVVMFFTDNFADAFTTVALVWAIISPFVLLGTSMVACRLETIKSIISKHSER